MILSEDELTRLFRAEHWDPFSLLGRIPRVVRERLVSWSERLCRKPRG